MATYPEIQAYVRANGGPSVKNCWIADVKRRHGLISRSAPNRIDSAKPVYPCPPEKIARIEAALKRFQMISCR